MNARDEDRDRDTVHSDDELTPALQRAVAALRPLPPTSPGAAARVVAAAATAGTVRRAHARRWSAGALAAVAACVAIVVARGRDASPRVSLAASGTGPARVPAAAVRAVGNGTDAASADLPRPVTFALRRPDARSVAVVGDFNGWDAGATPLARRPDGAWVATLSLTPGRHAYRFVVDDSLRVLDPRAAAERDPELGVSRSIVVVGVR